MRRSIAFTVPLVAAVSMAVSAGSSIAAEPLRDVIDARIEATWKEQEIQPAAPAGDAEFLRRVHLDLVGTIPSYEEAVAFLADEDPAKREKLVDELLADPRFGTHQANVWDLVYFGRSPGNSRVREREGFRKWLAERFNQNTPYDQWALAMLKAEGSTVEEGAPTFLLQYAGNERTAAIGVSRLFMGMQLQCAECHDHPFEAFTQLDFYGLAAFYSRMQPVSLKDKDGQKNFAVGEKNLGEVLFTGPQIDQKPGDKGEPVKPKFLEGEKLQEPELPKDVQDPKTFPNGETPPKPYFSRKDALAEWIVDPDNPYFTKAVANRVWAQFMGRGIIHPVDNLSDLNPPSDPELWERLTADLVAHQYDLKWLIREIVNTRAYQLASAGPVDRPDPRWFEQAKVRPLIAEELAASMETATRNLDLKAAAGNDDNFKTVRSLLISRFGEPLNGVGVYQGDVFENLHFANEGNLQQFLYDSGRNQLLADMANSEATPEEKIDEMFLTVLSRRPTDAERAKYLAYVGQATEPTAQATYWADAIWVLLASSEFRFNH
ncbi:MAG: DUF1549 and DUF1553 domain-containing protein [Planctomycetaceae bacterium]